MVAETRITATDLARGLSDILSRIHRTGERFVIERNGERIAVIGPAPRGMPVEAFAEGIADLDAVGEGFAEDLEAVQAKQPKAESPVWPS